ncbi:hypothetical protein NVP1081O_187 [Vibrio phage 1.081.O._10N.286.52.C2]|nr:hypothetical protein NVP1081O_187 [Vibrio phage 1.081.O._10N.286.52.C2]
MQVTLPRGIRIEIVDNDNLIWAVGTRATLAFEEVIGSNRSNNVWCVIDGETMTSSLPFEQCKIVTDNFKKSFKGFRHALHVR